MSSSSTPKWTLGQDPDDDFFILDECHYLLQEMGHTVHGERYEYNILRALPVEYERVIHRQLREARLWAGRHPAHGTHHVRRQPLAPFQREADLRSRHCDEGGGPNGSNVQCTYYKGLGHAIEDCGLLKENEHQRGPRQSGQQVQRSQHTPRQDKAAPGGVRRRTDGKQWCSFHRSTTHSNADWRMQHPQQFSHASGSATSVAF